MMVVEGAGSLPQSRSLVGCSRREMLSIARSILVYMSFRRWSRVLVSVYVDAQYRSIDSTVTRKKSPLTLSGRFGFQIVRSLSSAAQLFDILTSTSLSE